MSSLRSFTCGGGSDSDGVFGQAIDRHPYYLILCRLASVVIFVSCFAVAHVLLSVVASIEEVAEKYSIPKAFIGVILLPLVVRHLLFTTLLVDI